MDPFSPFNQSLETSPAQTDYDKFQNSDRKLLAVILNQILGAVGGQTSITTNPQSGENATINTNNSPFTPTLQEVSQLSLSVPANSDGNAFVVLITQSGNISYTVAPGEVFSLPANPGTHYRIQEIVSDNVQSCIYSSLKF